MPERAFELALLERASASTIWPATPDLTQRVAAAITAPPRAPMAARPSTQAGAGRRGFGLQSWPAFAALAVVGAVVALLAALAVPTSRSAIADFFGIEGSRVDRLPTPAPGTTPTPLPSPRDDIAGARVVTLAQAEEALGFPLLLPDGAPDALMLVEYGDQPVVIARYAAFDLWQTRLAAGATFGKEVPSTGVIDEFTLEGGTPARWITGGPHIVFYELPDGTRIDQSERVVGDSTLIWNRGGTFFRMETALDRAGAVAVAGSLR